MSRKRDSRPNVLLIISDQQRYDTLGCTGQSGSATPNIDRLAAHGTLFEQAFCTTPICTPARASLLSGLYPHTHGSVANHQQRPGCDQMKLGYGYQAGGRLSEAGGIPDRLCRKVASRHRLRPERLFRLDGCPLRVRRWNHAEQNEIIQHARKLGITISDAHESGLEPEKTQYDGRLCYGPSLLELADHPASLMCDRAIQFIHDAAAGDRPFLLAWSCHEPHHPFVCPEPFISRYRPAAMPLPESRRDEHTVRYLEQRRADGILATVDNLSDRDLQVMWAGYLGAVSYVDYLVGRLMAALHQENLYDDTLIIFTSDHGELLGSHGMWRKGSAMFEELIHIPLIIVAPGGGGRPRRCAELVSHVDLLPTILDYCGVEVPAALHGVPISSLVEGDERSRQNRYCRGIPLRKLGRECRSAPANVANQGLQVRRISDGRQRAL